MKTVIEGKNIELTQALKDHINEKFERLEKHYDQIIKGHDIKVKLSVEKNPRIASNNKVEVTIFLDGQIIRSEEATADMYNSIDTIYHKLDRQLNKYKTKVYRSMQHKERPLIENKDFHLPTDDLNTIENKIIRVKKFKLHAMTPEEATEHLDLIGHDFYVFINSQTKQINTLYQRKDGDYGLIEPVL